jgi:hypothetical protein
VIAKITRGARVGDIAAYLHGPGKANEHVYRAERDVVRGGQVIGGNLGREGDRSGARWAQDLRAAQSMRPAIWQTSLRSAPGDRRLSDAEWADAGQTFAERMGFDQHPWVMVRHGEDHVHIVTSRVSETGEVWHARQDFRQAQSAARQLEQEYGLTEAPRQRVANRVRTPAAAEREGYRGKQATLTSVRAAELARARETMSRVNAAFPTPAGRSAQHPKQTIDMADRVEAARRARENKRGANQDRGYER